MVKIILFLIIINITSLSYANEKIGLASFYTVKSSSSITANGEKYDENDLTCAIWDVPFNTLIKVTNLNNNKSVIVRTNDRGPNKRLKERIIDLTPKAFSLIGNLKDGLIKVKIEILK